MNEQKKLIEYMIQDVVDMLATDQNIEYDEAMNKFYNSEVFEKLQDEETGLYLESSGYVYDLFKDELNFGHIIQAEIQIITVQSDIWRKFMILYHGSNVEVKNPKIIQSKRLLDFGTGFYLTSDYEQAKK